MNVLDKATTVAETKYVYDKLRGEIDMIAGMVKVESWADVQKIVRAGMAAKFFAVGDQLTCQKDGSNLVWDIIGIDHDTPADPQYTHSMTLQLHDCFQTVMQFDAPEAFYYAENGLEAGTYHFTIDSSYDASHQNFNNYQFTLTQDVPAGGQLTFPWGSTVNASTIKVNSFASATSTTAIEQVAVSEGTDGANLGTLTAAGDFANNLNSIHRVRYGSNNYKESAIRQWLNKSNVADPVWTAQNNFDRPPTWYTDNNTAGFVDGMDADFLAVLGNVTKVTAISGSNTPDTTTDTFFLLSRSEVYGGIEVSGVNEGAAYLYYADYSDLTTAGMSNDSNRIKYRNGSAQYWWIRTPYYGSDVIVRYVSSTGGSSGGNAPNSYGIAPACNII